MEKLRQKGYLAQKTKRGVKVSHGVRRAKIEIRQEEGLRVSPRLSRLNVLVSLTVWFVLVAFILTTFSLETHVILFTAILSVFILPFPYYAWRASFELVSDVNSCLEPVFEAYEGKPQKKKTGIRKRTSRSRKK